MRSMPLSSESGTRLTFATGRKASGSACQMKASALSKSGLRGGSGAKPLQRPGNPLDKAPNWFLEVHGPSFKALAAPLQSRGGPL